MRLPVWIITAALLGSRAVPYDELVWPPKGPTWETDPEAAFAKARAAGKGVFVYVATEGCPHCKVMAREVWPKEAVIAASQDAICLAVYRWRENEAPASQPGKPAPKQAVADSEWATRLDVKAYPQIRLLDGFGRTLPSSAAHEMDRKPEHVVAAIAAANAEGKAAKPPLARQLPADLLSRLPGRDRDLALDPIGSVRCRAWLPALKEGEWRAEDLVTLLRTDDDPVLRLRLIERLGTAQLDAAAIEALAEVVEGNNDYVRGAALKLLGRTGGERAVRALRETIGKAVGGKTGWKNPNNVLIEAIDASIATADPTLVDVLGRVLERHGANNYATVLATKSLVAIGRKAGADVVRPHLERAAQLEGGQAAQIRKEVEAFLGGE